MWTASMLKVRLGDTIKIVNAGAQDTFVIVEVFLKAVVLCMRFVVLLLISGTPDTGLLCC